MNWKHHNRFSYCADFVNRVIILSTFLEWISANFKDRQRVKGVKGRGQTAIVLYFCRFDSIKSSLTETNGHTHTHTHEQTNKRTNRYYSWNVWISIEFVWLSIWPTHIESLLIGQTVRFRLAAIFRLYFWRCLNSWCLSCSSDSRDANEFVRTLAIKQTNAAPVDFSICLLWFDLDIDSKFDWHEVTRFESQSLSWPIEVRKERRWLNEYSNWLCRLIEQRFCFCSWAGPCLNFARLKSQHKCRLFFWFLTTCSHADSLANTKMGIKFKVNQIARIRPVLATLITLAEQERERERIE